MRAWAQGTQNGTANGSASARPTARQVPPPLCYSATGSASASLPPPLKLWRTTWRDGQQIYAGSQQDYNRGNVGQTWRLAEIGSKSLFSDFFFPATDHPGGDTIPNKVGERS